MTTTSCVPDRDRDGHTADRSGSVTFPGFRVDARIVLNKPFLEHLKFFVKDVLAYFGYNHCGWHDRRRYYYTPGQFGPHLTVDRLDAETVRTAARRSAEVLAALRDDMNAIAEPDFLRTTQGQALPLLRAIMTRDPVERRILDVGCSYARVFRGLALEFPEFSWDMVDFPPNLAEINSSIRTPNMHFHSAYPLDFIERTQAGYDVANFNRVMAVMGPGQVGQYLNALRTRARYVVFAEPCKILFEPGSLDIDAIPVDRPRCYNGSFLVHNYRGLFARHGYDLIHYDADSSTQANSTSLHFIIRGVAVART